MATQSKVGQTTGRKVGQASLPASPPHGEVVQASLPDGEVGQASVPAIPSLANFEPPRFRRATFDAYFRRLPHWRIDGATYFVTWRLRSRPDLSPAERTLVSDALRHFEGERYHLLAWVVMNDHVHVLVYPFPGCELKQLLHSWKSYTANQLQRRFGRPGRVWLDESFDRVVRDENELMQKLYYILNNPFKRWSEIQHYDWVGVHEALADIGPVGAPVAFPEAGTEACPTSPVGQASLPASPPDREVGQASLPARTHANTSGLPPIYVPVVMRVWSCSVPAAGPPVLSGWGLEAGGLGAAPPRPSADVRRHDCA
jgi:putative transposase